MEPQTVTQWANACGISTSRYYKGDDDSHDDAEEDWGVNDYIVDSVHANH